MRRVVGGRVGRRVSLSPLLLPPPLLLLPQIDHLMLARSRAAKKCAAGCSGRRCVCRRRVCPATARASPSPPIRGYDYQNTRDRYQIDLRCCRGSLRWPIEATSEGTPPFVSSRPQGVGIPRAGGCGSPGSRLAVASQRWARSWPGLCLSQSISISRELGSPSLAGEVGGNGEWCGGVCPHTISAPTLDFAGFTECVGGGYF